MALLAIKGHSTRGSEVISLLEMLGGKNKYQYIAILETHVYFVDGDTINSLRINLLLPEQFIVFTLEQFEEKFPYKVGDKVISPASRNIHTVESIHWDGNKIYYNTVGEGFNTSYTAKDLQPYKEQEETMEEITDKAIAPVLTGEDLSEKRFGYKIPNGYEFDCIKHNEIIIKPKQPQYPATYEECCEVLNKRTFLGFNGLSLGEIELYRPFIKLMGCRDAYWKIAGSWKPDWADRDQPKFVISIVKEKIELNEYYFEQKVLAFPTEEMRDAFYENFKELIEQCKEVL